MTRTARSAFAFLAFAVASGLGSAPARAADATPAQAKPPSKPAAKAAEGSLGKGTASGPLLTKEQLRQCINEQARQKEEGAALVQAQGDLAKTRAEMDRLGAELNADLATLDRTSEAAVTAYNQKVRDRAKLAEAYQAGGRTFNERVDKFDAAKQAYAKDCADRRYLDEDFDAIQAGK